MLVECLELPFCINTIGLSFSVNQNPIMAFGMHTPPDTVRIVHCNFITRSEEQSFPIEDNIKGVLIGMCMSIGAKRTRPHRDKDIVPRIGNMGMHRSNTSLLKYFYH